MKFLFFVEDLTLNKSARLSYGDKQLCKKNVFLEGKARIDSNVRESWVFRVKPWNTLRWIVWTVEC